MTEARFLAGPLGSEVERALRRLAAAPDVVHLAVMPDVHLAEEVCVGVAMATTRLVYPAAVGGDIGCGMAAIRFDGEAARLRDRAALLSGLRERVPRGRHRRADFCPWPDDLDPERLSTPTLGALARGDGRAQLGTLGSGNHFIELQVDGDGALWLMLHSGSRAIGPAVRSHHARGLVGLDGDEAAAYVGDMEWALAYAEANRRALLARACDAVSAALGAAPVDDSLITCVHNHVCRQQHGGRALWVHRKGAMPAAAGQPGVVPGSMGTSSYHVEGRGNPEALASSAHGAGRAMSRSEARRRISPRELVRQMGEVTWDARRAALLRDEAPGAYKDIQRVMRAQSSLVRIVRRLDPLLSYKAT